MSKISKSELRKKVKGVLEIAPNFEAYEIWQALLGLYPYDEVEKAYNSIKKEKLEIIRSLPPKIMVVDDDEVKTLDQVIEDAERKKEIRAKGE